jgi:hypothetical protein
MSYLSEAPEIFFQRFYSGWITLRNQLTTPVRLMGRRVIELYDALLTGNDLEVTPYLSLKRRPGYLSYAPAVMNGTLMNTYSWRPASLNAVYQIFDTTADIEYIAPGATKPTVIFSKPVGAIGNKAFIYGVGNYLYVTGVGFAFKWDGPGGPQGVTNWGIAVGSVNAFFGPNAVGTGANVAGANWTNPANIQANDGAVSTVSVTGVAGSVVSSAGYLEGTNPGFSIPAASLISGIQVDVRGFVGTAATLRPTAHTGPYSNPTFAYDANFSTAAIGSLVESGIPGVQAETFSGFPASAGISIILNINSAVAISGAGCEATLSWSSNKGSGTIYDVFVSRSQQTDTVTLDPTTDTSTIVVSLSIQTPAGSGTSTIKQFVYEVWVQRGTTVSPSFSSLNLRLLKNGAVAGAVRTATPTNSDAFMTFGGMSDLWGTTWTPNDVNNSTFGAAIAASVANISQAYLFSVDFVQITVYGTGGPSVSIPGAGGSVSAVNGWTYVFAYGNSVSGEISNGSLPSANTGPFTNKTGVDVVLTKSNDPQVNQIHLYRTTDSGGGSIFYELPTSPYPNTSQTVLDSALDTSLQIDSQAAVNFENTPPPANMVATEWFAGRFWGAVGNLLVFSTGDDTFSGSEPSNWNPAYVFALPTNIARLIGTPNGMLVNTLDDCYIVRGTETVNFTVNEFARDISCRNYNAADTDGSNIYIFTSDRQLLQIGGSGMTDVGQVIGDQLLNVDPSQAYLSIYRYGLDSMLFLLDPANGVLYPYNVPQQCWCLPALLQFSSSPTAAGAMEISPGVWKYIIGAGTSLGQRDLATFADLGNTYSPVAVIGAITLADPLSLAKVENLILQLTSAGSTPDLSVFVNDAGVNLSLAVGNQVTGSFTSLSVGNNPLQEPPTYAAQATAFRNLRYQWALCPLPAQIQFFQAMLQWSNEQAANELIGFGISGKNQGDSPQASKLPELQGH